MSEDAFIGQMTVHADVLELYRKLRSEYKPMIVAVYFRFLGDLQPNLAEYSVWTSLTESTLTSMFGYPMSVFKGDIRTNGNLMKTPIVLMLSGDDQYMGGDTKYGATAFTRALKWVMHIILFCEAMKDRDPIPGSTVANKVHRFQPLVKFERLLTRWYRRGFDLVAKGYNLVPDDRKIEREYRATLRGFFAQYVNEGYEKGVAPFSYVQQLELPSGWPEEIMYFWDKDLRRQVPHFHDFGSFFAQHYMGDPYVQWHVEACMERVYYRELQLPPVVGRPTLYDIAEAGLRHRFPVTLMTRHTSGFRVQIWAENVPNLVTWFKLHVMRTDTVVRGFLNNNAVLAPGFLMTIKELYQEVRASRLLGLEDETTWHTLPATSQFTLCRLLLLYRWAVRSLGRAKRVGDAELSPDDIGYAFNQIPFDELLTQEMSTQNPQYWAAYLKHSGFERFRAGGSVRDTVEFMTAWKDWLWGMHSDTVDQPARIGVKIILYIIGFEKLRQQQFGLFMAMHDLLSRPGVVRVTDNGPRGRFLRILSKLTREMASSVAETFTGDTFCAVSDWSDIHVSLSRDVFKTLLLRALGKQTLTFTNLITHFDPAQK